ncbi:MAG: hypothetical protein KDI68_16975 [Gammaproteobacteria bacterium]|nr:hypothetical protein [Gammaproteobacteria bacterium]
MLLFLLLAAVAVYKVMPLLNPEVARVAPLDPACDLRAGPCSSDLPGGGRVTFAISPAEIPVVKPLTLDVKVEGIPADSVEIDFQGVDMNMGFNRPRLSRLSQGHFSGPGMIPVCVRDAMEWEARVLVASDDGLIAAPYRFITVKPGVELPTR